MEKENCRPLTQERFTTLVNQFKKRFNLDDELAHEAAVNLLQKNGFEDRIFSNRMIYFSFVDVLRKRFGRTDGEEDSVLVSFRRSLYNAEEIDDHKEHLYVPKDEIINIGQKVIDIIRTKASRRYLAVDNKVKRRGRTTTVKRRKMSVRRILFKAALGWSYKEIAQMCGLSESRISQVIDAECKRLSKYYKK